jgi:ABC-2 type transport system permease protein
MTTMTATVPAPPLRSAREDLRGLPRAVRSEWIKLSTVRTTKALGWLTVALGLISAWASAEFANDPVQTVSQVFVFSTVLTGTLAAVSGILLFTSEAQHGTLAGTLTAQPSRWVTAAAKTVMAASRGLWLGAAGMTAGFVGGLLGGLEIGSVSTIVETALWALLYTSLAAVLGLGVGMLVRHSSAALSGVLVWGLVLENLLTVFTPESASRFLPFVAGNNLLGIVGTGAFAEDAAYALSRSQTGLVFAAYAAAALVAGTVLLYRRDTN